MDLKIGYLKIHWFIIIESMKEALCFFLRFLDTAIYTYITIDRYFLDSYFQKKL